MRGVRLAVVHLLRVFAMAQSVLKKIVSRRIPRIEREAKGVWEPDVKTLCSPFSFKFWRHCMLTGGSQRRAFPNLVIWKNAFSSASLVITSDLVIKKKKIINISFPQVGIAPTIVGFLVAHFCPCAMTAPQMEFTFNVACL